MAGMDEDDRAFMHELLRRQRKSTDAMISRADAGFERMLKRFDAETDLLREHTRKMAEDHREFIEELRAQRAAAFRILDRLDEGPAGAGA
jgi:hypothetical protein